MRAALGIWRQHKALALGTGVVDAVRAFLSEAEWVGLTTAAALRKDDGESVSTSRPYGRLLTPSFSLSSSGASITGGSTAVRVVGALAVARAPLLSGAMRGKKKKTSRDESSSSAEARARSSG